MKNFISKNELMTVTRWALPLLAVLFVITGCETGGQFTEYSPAQLSKPSEPVQSVQPAQSEPIILREGDVLEISFPSSASLDTTQQIRRDGKIVLPLIGEVTAAGKTPEDLQNELVKLYAPQVATKEVIVTVQSSTLQVYVTGAVLRPGPVAVDHPISALEAIMQAGGFDTTKANLKAVVVIRQGKEGTTKYTLNLEKAMRGGHEKPFYLKPSDIVNVPEKFTWF